LTAAAAASDPERRSRIACSQATASPCRCPSRVGRHRAVVKTSFRQGRVARGSTTSTCPSLWLGSFAVAAVASMVHVGATDGGAALVLSPPPPPLPPPPLPPARGPPADRGGRRAAVGGARRADAGVAGVPAAPAVGLLVAGQRARLVRRHGLGWPRWTRLWVTRPRTLAVARPWQWPVVAARPLRRGCGCHPCGGPPPRQPTLAVAEASTRRVLPLRARPPCARPPPPPALSHPLAGASDDERGDGGGGCGRCAAGGGAGAAAAPSLSRPFGRHRRGPPRRVWPPRVRGGGMPVGESPPAYSRPRGCGGAPVWVWCQSEGGSRHCGGWERGETRSAGARQLKRRSGGDNGDVGAGSPTGPEPQGNLNLEVLLRCLALRSRSMRLWSRGRIRTGHSRTFEGGLPEPSHSF